MKDHFIWLKFPFLRYALALMAGIISAYFIDENVNHLIIASAVLISAYILIAIFLKTQMVGVLGLFAIAFLGFLSYQVTDQSEHSESFSIDRVNYYSIEIHRSLKESERSLSYRGTVTYLKKENWEKVSIDIIIYIPVNFPIKLISGDNLLIKGPPRILEKPANYGEFDYGFYLKTKGIFLRDYIPENRIISHYSAKKAFSFIDSIREYVSMVLTKTVNSSLESGVAKALLLGDKNQLDKALSKSYANSGTIHVLAVSGLHVGIIFIALSNLFKPIKNKWLKAVLLIFSLSVYAILTGMSPSVLRATVMFSIVIIGRAITKVSGIYNSLGIAAFFLLLFNPMLLFSVGFQMSFLAVFSIVLFQPRVYSLFPGIKGIGNYFWKLSSVSIAAQILTFPLGLYYFSQFPTYFVFSNLVVIPLVSFTVVLSFIVIIIYPIILVSTPLAWVNDKLLVILNSFVSWIGNLPFSVLETDYISIEIAVLIYGLIYVLYQLFNKRTFVNLIYFILIACLIISVDLYDIQRQSKPSIMLYSFRDPILLDFISKRTSYQYGEVTISKMQYSVVPTRERMRVKRSGVINFVSSLSGIDFIVFKNKVICIVNSSENIEKLNAFPFSIDYLFVNTKLAKKEIEDLNKSSISIFYLDHLKGGYHIFSS